MAKIFSGLTLLAALAAIYFGFQSKALVEKLRVAADREHTDLLSTRDNLKKKEKELEATKEELTVAKDELTKTKDLLVKAEEAKKAAETQLADANQKKDAAEAQYATVKKSFDDLKAKFGEKDPEQIVQSIAAMETANKDLTAKVATLENDYASQKIVVESLTKEKKATEEKIASKEKVIDRYQKNIMQKGVRGHVLAVNSGWGFCVLSIGDRQGAAANKIMIVARNGQSIGKVKIINVEANQSVADIIPSSFVRGSYVEPGDEVIFTGEDKVREEPATAAPTAPAAVAPGVPPLPVH